MPAEETAMKIKTAFPTGVCITNYHTPCWIPTTFFNVRVNGVMVIGTDMTGPDSFPVGESGEQRPYLFECIADRVRSEMQKAASEGKNVSMPSIVEPTCKCPHAVPQSVVGLLLKVEIPLGNLIWKKLRHEQCGAQNGTSIFKRPGKAQCEMQVDFFKQFG